MHQRDRQPEKENAMYAIEVLLPLFFIRLVLPLALLLAVGQLVRNHQDAQRLGR
jgi:hypothetical protein